MHELSIALGIVDLAEKEAIKAGGNKIEAIELVVGKLSGVVMEALDFVWSSAVTGTMLENAERSVIEPDGKAKCLDCGNIFLVENLYDPCNVCNSYIKDIIEGKELQIKSITVV